MITLSFESWDDYTPEPIKTDGLINAVVDAICDLGIPIQVVFHNRMNAEEVKVYFLNHI